MYQHKREKNLGGENPLFIATTKQKIYIMVRTTSLKHYKELKAKGICVQLVTKQDLNK